MFKKLFTLYAIIFSSISIFATSININYNIPVTIENDIKNSVKAALALALSSRIEINDDKEDLLIINIDTLSYEENKHNLSLSFDSKYIDKELKFNIYTLDCASKIAMLESLKNKVYDSYKYDAADLFGDKINLNLNYYDPSLSSFAFNKDNPPSLGTYYYIKNEKGDKIGLASINSRFENNASLNILYNDGLTPALNLEKAPRGMLSVSSSYDYINDNIYGSINYTLLHSFLPFLNKANFSISGGFSYDSNVMAGTFDIGLVMDLPLSLIFNSESLFKNSGIRISSFGGTNYQNKFRLNSKYSIGYYFYFLSKYNFEIYVENNTLLFDDSATSSLNVGYKISILI
ncbi:MAG: hypothetical protein JJE21_03800 [Spirochaetaceae bacterium]|nr:hypothetical protein [Spirochaetaceae bacterium]